ncbi:MAG: 2-oxoglutarate dehydrogenase E1 component [Pseudomonadota bacterium]
MRDTDFLGAGDPGALDAILGPATEAGAHHALAEAYRRFGWQVADLDPLRLQEVAYVPELAPERYGLGSDAATALRRAYCGTIGWQIGHIADAEKRNWLAEQAEAAWMPEPALRQRALDLIASAEVLEATFDRRLPGAKTFGLSGCESFVPLLWSLLAHGTSRTDRAYVAGVHRGRSTEMALVFGKPLARIVADAMGIEEFPQDLGASSDSPYHLGWEGEAQFPDGPLALWIAPHPSHLSVVAPVMQGRARAARDRGERVLPVAIHTDAAFAGQGINAEVLQLSGLKPFEIGGTIHLVLNNQIGFTTDTEQGRTASTTANVARMTDAPVLHVNGDDPDAVLRAAEVAQDWRETFASDIVIDLVGYRRKGHNEIDQPRFTQPKMYHAIDALTPLSKRYATVTGLQPDTVAFHGELDAGFEAARSMHANDLATPLGLAADVEIRMLDPVATGLSGARISELTRKLTEVPTGLDPHPKVADFLSNRRTSVDADSGIDWATAEALALASLLDEGTPVRLGGQDSLRGAFTQRHLELHCQSTNAVWSPLAHFRGPLSLHNTPLIENAVLAFEYGYSLQAADGLTIWEAQFGDFLNVAQAIFDQFIICGEDRWLSPSNLVLLLPHGIDGGGPDHATAHPERLLNACAKGNIQVINPSTPANYFHVLRRQVLADWKKPLVVLAPKTLLRHPAAKSRLIGFEVGFESVTSDVRTAPRVVMSTGKLSVLLEQERNRLGADVALIRLEQLYPLDAPAIAEAVARYPEAELIWAQEEPENMGYFLWLDRKLEAATGRRWTCVSRPASPSASAGPKKWDDAHLERVIADALGVQE